MKIIGKKEESYRVPDELNDFQRKLYLHLIDWKWGNITKEPGYYGDIPYDAILPEKHIDSLPIIYPGIKEKVEDHIKNTDLRKHKFFNHMASSQAACFNLFFPILLEKSSAEGILGQILPSFKKIAVNELCDGFQFEYGGGSVDLLKDHSPVSGTDSDLAIAYYNKNDELCMWLIEHKLSEPEFTKCNAAISKGRKEHHDCSDIIRILENPDLCYYHSEKKYAYWEYLKCDTTHFDINMIKRYEECPFKGGNNQLWRNQLLAIAIELSDDHPYTNVRFSVVHHSGNSELSNDITKHISKLKKKDRFFTFTSLDIIQASIESGNKALAEWANWYKELYYFE